MTRFDAATPAERRKLVADAVAAHRERGSAFLTVELDRDAVADRENGDDTAGDGDAADDPSPWIQFADRTFNMDCTDAELERLKEMLEEFPEFRIESLESPEETEGTNVRISARSDASRLAAFVDRAFAAVYGAPEGYRAWVVRV
jgi:hypothetical protein